MENSDITEASFLSLYALDDDISVCCIANPWNPDAVAAQYLLVPASLQSFDETRRQQIEDHCGPCQVLRTPLQHLCLTASCQAWLLGQLGATEAIAVMCDTAYVLDLSLRQALLEGRIGDGGNSMAPNVEVMLDRQCDALWISPFENPGIGARSQQMPLPVIYGADYMETSPLGRAEWMRFYGRLVGRGAQADSLFQQVASRYRSLSRSQAPAAARPQSSAVSPNAERISAASAPTLLTDLPYGATWYVPGGCSTMGQLYRDAGFRYLWADDNHSGSLALSPEAVLSRGLEADFWLIKYNNPNGELTLPQLCLDSQFSQFKAVHGHQVYGCNTAHSDYFDVVPFRPDLLLGELQRLINGQTDSLHYYHPIL